MTYRVAINGFGRIGRDYLRSLFDRALFDEGIVVVGINDLWDAATLTHLFQYDSTFGPLDRDIILLSPSKNRLVLPGSGGYGIRILERRPL